jgi:hypothetical protein
VRVIEAEIAMTGTDGSRIADSYRIITTMTGHRAYPADAVIRPYHERREIESAYLALRHTLLNGQVLRSGDRPGIEQELWALPCSPSTSCCVWAWSPRSRPGPAPTPRGSRSAPDFVHRVPASGAAVVTCSSPHSSLAGRRNSAVRSMTASSGRSPQ